MLKFYLFLILSACCPTLPAQNAPIPASYANLVYDPAGRLYFEKNGERFYADTAAPAYTLDQLRGNPLATAEGVVLDFGDPGFKGTVSYGLIPYGLAPHPLPAYLKKRSPDQGKLAIDVRKDFRNPYDMVGWQKSGHLSIGYRVQDASGMLLYDGIISLLGTGPFELAPTIVEGPYLAKLEHNGAVIWFETNLPVAAGVQVGEQFFPGNDSVTHHEIALTGLKPDTRYAYTVLYGDFSQTYALHTAPQPGARLPFTFAYNSDSRSALGGGERMAYGANAYIVKKSAALALQQNAAFFQFTGDMIDGYLANPEEHLLQLANWKRAAEPFWHYMPIYTGQGNHEALGQIFRDKDGRWAAFVDGFPFDTHSAEANFARAFVHPENGPDAEDGGALAPELTAADFPSYRETVFFYTYDNVAMVVLNSNYWYAPLIQREPSTGGNLHGYLMDRQLQWLEQTLQQLELDPAVDHVFITFHTPCFPNGGHMGDDMWYNGNNARRPTLAGKAVPEGIIERRDRLLDLLINKSSKTLAILCGDEHNYNRLLLTDSVNIYPDGWDKARLKVSRPIWQVTNGAAGAPYYAQESGPWSAHTQMFTVQHALCLFDINGPRVTMRVLNPDALNVIDEVQMR